MINNEIFDLRHDLHKYPEVSNNEFNTAERIVNFMESLKPDELIELGKTGKAFVFNGNQSGKTIVFRAELDALPISENSLVEHSSINKNAAHSCGHDGHMAIIAGLAKEIVKNSHKKGKVVFLFQHAEEIEQGAKDVMESPGFKKLDPDYIFALHNIPGVEKHKIILKNGVFAAASKGMTIELFGKTSHAAEPEKGKNPALAVSEIINEFNELINNITLFSDFILLTFVFIRMGEISPGTSAGNAKIGITLRAFEDEDMKLMTKKTREIIDEICINEDLKYKIEYNEIFPATVNDDICVSLIEDAAIENNLVTEYIEEPFKWSEDFAYYTEKYKTGYFGLGSGINQPALHNPEFDFPDEIIETGIKVFSSIYKQLNIN
ncbi:MAG: amidohydrolase [Bacteroidota bacterium]|nr:amidohydrolase [Bacteroidota bacterium]